MNKELLIELKAKLQKAKKEKNKEEIVAIKSFLENPKLATEEFYEENNKTGYASVDRPHKKFFKKGTLEAEFPKMKMYDYMYLRNKNNPNFTALNFYGRKITYEEMFRHIEDCAKAFLQQGIKEGDYVVIAMPTTPESVYMLFALNRIGAIPVEIDPRTSKEDISSIITDSQTKLYVTMEDCSPVIDSVMNEKESVKNQLEKVLLISPTESLPFGLNIASNLKDSIDRAKGEKPPLPKGDEYLSWRQFIIEGRKYQGKMDSDYKEGTTAEIVYSSGTTNKPKAIQYTNETFTGMVRQLELGENDYAPRDKNLNIIPMYLGFGSNNALYVILSLSMEDILIPVPVVDNLPQIIQKYRPNHLLGAPIHMNVLLNYLKYNPNKMKDLSYLKSLVSGSAALESARQYELDYELSKRGCKIKVGPGYGQNEGGPTLSFSPDTFLEMKKPGCSGYPLSHTIISIFDPESGEELPYGQDLEGELRYQTPCVMKGYAFSAVKDTDNYFKKDKNGNVWACSGDLGKIDSDGGIYVTGRITRQIHRMGFKFSPTEIEDYIIDSIPSIKECTLIAIPDEEEESKTVLYYTMKPESIEYAPIVEQELKSLCATLKDYKRPCEIIQREEIPLTQNLKVDFRSLEKEAEKMFRESVKVLKKENI